MSKLTLPEKKLILTFGYGNRKDYDTLLDYIKEFNISCVIDVRISPRAWSRKWYGDAIEKFCTFNSIQYISRSSLGNTSGCEHWIPPEKEEAQETLSEVAEMIKTGNILLLCAEMDSSRCHRTEVASQLKELTNALVKHLK
jgi:uncharacterized protein (DUF488 family)